jgi:hypothetical protein
VRTGIKGYRIDPFSAGVKYAFQVDRKGVGVLKVAEGLRRNPPATQVVIPQNVARASRDAPEQTGAVRYFRIVGHRYCLES